MTLVRQPFRYLNTVVTIFVLAGFSICYLLLFSSYRTNISDVKQKAASSYPTCWDNELHCEVLKTSLKGAKDLTVGKARYDNKRLLRIYDFHHTGSEWEALIRRYDVCFATQTSVERIYWLPHLLDKWTGPLSIAVHLIGQAEWIIFNFYMCYLSNCHQGFSNRVALHLAVPSNFLNDLALRDEVLSQWNITNVGEIYEKGQSCPEPKQYLNYLLDTFPTLDKAHLKLKEVYPQNQMRNIARKSCGVHWTYSADVDIIPRDGMADMLQEFYESRKEVPCEKCAYVIPTFEVNETATFPRNKQEIVNLFKEGTARSFHGKYFAEGHNATDYEKWISTNLKDDKVNISHGILIKGTTTLYEPFYVSSDEIPPFDERFLGYGFTRNSQFKAAFYSGWNFTVLTPVFSIHWGLQTKDTVLSPKKDGVGKAVRKEQTQANYKLYKKFLQELELKKKLELF